jgi:leucine dehydrogenase
MAVPELVHDLLDPLPRADGPDHELLLVRRGARTGVQMIVAVHSTVLGPALGGCRIWHYETLDAAIEDALRLSGAMTLKAAAAQLTLGGGKSVIRLPAGMEPRGSLREALLADFADGLNLLDGRYITAEDVGSSAEDMQTLSRLSRFVVGSPPQLGGSGDPGAFTALGVLASMRACCARRYGSADLRGRTVAIVGTGHVGEPLARLLGEEGASLVLSDIDESRAALARELGASWLDPQAALRAEVDILAPCAMGAVLDGLLVEELRCAIVCGSANNQLARDELAERLAARGILYAPDFIVNSGGLINVSLELTGYDPALATRRVSAIEGVLGDVLDHAESESITPLAAAIELAGSRLAAGAHPPQP